MLNNSSVICSGTNKSKVMPKGSLILKTDRRESCWIPNAASLRKLCTGLRTAEQIFNRWKEKHIVPVSSLQLPKKANAERGIFSLGLGIRLCRVFLIERRAILLWDFHPYPRLSHQLAKWPQVRPLCSLCFSGLTCKCLKVNSSAASPVKDHFVNRAAKCTSGKRQNKAFATRSKDWEGFLTRSEGLAAQGTALRWHGAQSSSLELLRGFASGAQRPALAQGHCGLRSLPTPGFLV